MRHIKGNVKHVLKKKHNVIAKKLISLQNSNWGIFT